jgi:hypothetical protein
LLRWPPAVVLGHDYSGLTEACSTDVERASIPFAKILNCNNPEICQPAFSIID